MSDPAAVPGLAELPEEVRARVVSLAADALPQVPRLPAPVRKVADFAPARRARLGAGPLGAALDGDDDFRERVGVQVAARLPAPVEDAPPAAPAADPRADPVESAALAWLLRPDGWQERLTTALAAVAERTAREPEEDDGAARWRDKARAAEQALREARTRHRADLAGLKEENARLRRTLGETRAALAAATAAAQEATDAADVVRRGADAAAHAREKELRQLRARLERLEAEARQDRRASRADRDDSTIRARLLLDTLVDAAQGLRRELSLPPVSGAPADRVEAGLAEVAGGGAAARAGGPAVGPGLLEQYLTMPRARLIVDGYNVSKTAWGNASLEVQRHRLVTALAALVARTGAEATVVFDAGATASRPFVAAPRGVKVRFSPEGVIADDVIRDLVSVEPEGRVVVVVSSDRELGGDVARTGAHVVPAESLIGLLDRAG